VGGVSSPVLPAERLVSTGINAETGAVGGSTAYDSIVAAAAIGARSTPTMLRGKLLENMSMLSYQ
jgi:hypothetical protein